MARRFVSLMYHEIERPGRPLCRSDAGYVRYVVRESEFGRHLSRIHELGFAGVSVSDARRADEQQPIVAITFDDGCATDLLIAAQALRQLAFSATFYLTRDFIGRPGFLTPTQARELAALGFEVGCHGATHRYLTDIDSNALDDEVRQAGIDLSQIVGAPVRQFSCPGGRWNAEVLERIRASGYETCATSEPGTSLSTDFRIRRSAVLRQTSLEAFTDVVLDRGQTARRAKAVALGIAKSVIGNASYERFRNLMLRERNPSDGGTQ